MIRHAESTANAGQITDSPGDFPLSEKGKIQARQLSTQINTIPDLIVISSYQRSHQTALPLIQKFPNVPVEVWPVHEFHFLCDQKYINTTPQERRPFREEYFRRNDNEYVDGPSCESFNQLIERVENFWNRLDRSKNTIIFSHGHFMNAVRMKLLELPMTISTFCKMPEIQNIEIIEI